MKFRSMSGIEEWMRTMEDAAELMVEKFMKWRYFGLLFNIFMIAVCCTGRRTDVPGSHSTYFYQHAKTIIGESGSCFFLQRHAHAVLRFFATNGFGAMFGYLSYDRHMWVPSWRIS